MNEKLASAIERMPLVTELVQNLGRDGFRFDPQVLLFGVQHLMAQSLVLAWALNELGLSYDRQALCGKAYSTNAEVIRLLDEMGIQVGQPRVYRLGVAQAADQAEDIRLLVDALATRKAEVRDPCVLILDDGGHALTTSGRHLSRPFRAAGVEQTASGFWQAGVRSSQFPVVDVAGSAVKRHCEPPLITKATLERVRTLLDEKSGSRVGIVGIGYIGLSLCHALIAEGREVVIYDRRTDAYPRLDRWRARRVHDVIDGSDIIFGCTGTDITRGLAQDIEARSLTKRQRTFVSLSSGDDEFFTLKSMLLARAGNADASYDIHSIPHLRGELWGSSFEVLRNGFPVNFDNGEESVPLEQIQGTVAALIGALCQAFILAKNVGRYHPLPGRVMLDLDFQGWLFERWSRAAGAAAAKSGRPHLTWLERESRVRTEPVSVKGSPIFGLWTAATA